MGGVIPHLQEGEAEGLDAGVARRISYLPWRAEGIRGGIPHHSG